MKAQISLDVTPEEFTILADQGCEREEWIPFENGIYGIRDGGGREVVHEFANIEDRDLVLAMHSIFRRAAAREEVTV